MIRILNEFNSKLKQSVSKKKKQSAHLARIFSFSFRFDFHWGDIFSLCPRLLDGVTLRVISELLFSRSAIRRKLSKLIRIFRNLFVKREGFVGKLTAVTNGALIRLSHSKAFLD